MGQVGSNNEPVREAGLYAWDGTNWIKVKVDTNGNLIVNIQDLETIIAQSYGWVNSAWQKDPLRFGFSDTVYGSEVDNNLAAGINTLSGDIVPEGEIWVMTFGSIQYVGAVPTLIAIRAIYGGPAVTLVSQTAPVSGEWYDRQGWIVLQEGDNVEGRVTGATAGDTLRFQYGGFKVDIDQ